MASRIQRQRAKGWQMPEGAVYVGRPTAWGNPFTAESSGGLQQAVDAFEAALEYDPTTGFWTVTIPGRDTRHLDLRDLQDRDLACWCPLDGPCHGNLLLQLANRLEADRG